MQSLSQKLSITRSKIINIVLSIFNSWSLEFDGVDDYANMGHHSSIHPVISMTHSIWVKLDWDYNDATARDILSCYRYGNGWRLFWQAKEITAAVRIDNGSTNGQYKKAVSDYDIFGPNGAFFRASGWHNIVTVFDGYTIKLYIDGALHKSTSTTVSGLPSEIKYKTNNQNADLLLAATPSALVGGLNSTASNHLQCMLDEFSIWDVALSANEITDIFNNGVPFDLLANYLNYSSDSKQIAYWRAEEGVGSICADTNNHLSGNTNNALLINGVSFDSQTPS